MKRVVIKLSAGLLIRDGLVQKEWLDSLGELVADLHSDNYRVWLVTSGAQALGKLNHDPNLSRNILVAKGQHELHELYNKAFLKSGLEVAEILLNKDQFEHREAYLAIRHQFEILG